jgi:FixJ family two-component response regulator
MKKPLLLLVDDDRPVLEALRAELEPEFSDLCRFEAFDNPRSLLEEAAVWRVDGQSIALVIADQKMPGLSGVELLVALREDRLNRDLSAILLTGQGGLEVASDAKNRASVMAYLEKPWRRDDLLDRARAALAMSLGKSGVDAHFVFREIDSGEGALDALRLRYAVYGMCAATDALLHKDMARELDVDAYDGYARMFGCYLVQAAASRLVGTIRVVGKDPTALGNALAEVFPSDCVAGRNLRAPRAFPLPMQEYLVDRDAVSQLLERVAAGEDVVEPGRLALLPAHREGGAAGARHLARHMIEGSVSFFFFFRIMNAVLTCTPLHVAFYKPYGFELTNGTRVTFTPQMNIEVACLHGRLDRVPEPARSRCAEIAQRLAWAGDACRCENFPACLGGPYATGDFRATDLFCPAKARQLLVSAGPARG